MPNWKPGDPERRKDEIEDKEQKIVRAAEIAALAVSDAAKIALKTIAEAASMAQSVVNVDMGYIKRDVNEIKEMLNNKYITKEAFGPVKNIAYGLVSAVMLAVIGALMTLVLIKRNA